MKRRKKRTGMSKAEALRVQQRTDELVMIRLDGAQWWDVVQYVSEKSTESGSCWEVKPGGKSLSERQLRNYVTRADCIIRASVNEKRSRTIRRHLAQRANLYAKAVNAGDVRTALAVLRDEAELRGLYPPKKTQLTGKDGKDLIPPTPEKPLTDAERQAAVAAILARLGAGRN
jgi:hypothetical protein